MDALKEILLQISAAGSFLLMLIWGLGRRPALPTKEYPEDPCIMAASASAGVVLCSMLSFSLHGAIHLSLAILPGFIGMLYVPWRSRIGIAVLLFLSTLIVTEPSGPLSLMLNSGAFVYPLLLWLAPRFQTSNTIEKICILWMCLIPGLIGIPLAAYLQGAATHYFLADEGLTIIFYIFTSVVLGAIFVCIIEGRRNKRSMDQMLEGFRIQAQWENEKLQQITNAVPVSIMTVDDRGNVNGINENMLAMIQNLCPGVDWEGIKGKPAGVLLHNVRNPEAVERLRLAFYTRQRTSERIMTDTHSWHVFAAPLYSETEGKPGGMVLVIQDMTEEEKMRSELGNVERLTMVGQMAAGITHEIRNPMAVIRGFLQLMREKSPPDMEHYYRIVMEELDRANGIITDFLALAQSHSTNRERVDLHGIIMELSPLLWADANLRGQTVDIVLNKALPPLYLNVREIKQLILNLCRNGMEAMDDKGVLTLETRHTGGQVELIVSDTGCGIPEGKLKKLFEPFYTTKNQGTGLGLALCLGIVERHGGTIRVQSTEGEGTSFIVSFPEENGADGIILAEAE